METRLLTKEEVAKLNEWSREFLDKYYASNGTDGDTFFKIVDLYNVCKKQGFTVDEVPTLIEMQNVIVMG